MTTRLATLTLHIRTGFLALLSALCIAAATPSVAAEASLYDRIGGYKGVAATVDDLVDRIYVNGTLNANPLLKQIHDLNERAAFKLILATWVMEKTGGPKVYFGRDMKAAHAPLKLSNREFDVIMHECKETFYKFNVPEKEMGELMTALESYRTQIVASAP
jgi:hemoglobin